jgi:uncharacterized protein YhaN
VRVHRWSIDGFGSFVGDEGDLAVDPHGGGLTVVYGPNEAGKTTLMHFITGVLFGFPDGRRKGPRHEPLRGGNHGGRLEVSSPQFGRVTIARSASRRVLQLHNADGPLPPDSLDEILGHTTAAVYAHVFSVDLHSLHELQLLDDEALRARLFAVGTHGNGPTAADALRALADRRDALWRPASRATTRASVLRAQIDDTLTALASARLEVVEATAAHRHVEHLQAQIASAQDERLAAFADRRGLAAAVELWPTWQVGRFARDELAAMPGLGTEALADALSHLHPRQGAEAERAARIARLALRSSAGIAAASPVTATATRVTLALAVVVGLLLTLAGHPGVGVGVAVLVAAAAGLAVTVGRGTPPPAAHDGPDVELGVERAAQAEFARDVRRVAATFGVPADESPAVVLDALLARLEEQRAHEAAVERADRALSTHCAALLLDPAQVTTLLANPDPTGWRASLTTLDDRVASLDAERDQATRQMLRAEDDIERVLDRADVVALDQRLVSLTTDLAQVVLEWRTVSAAHAMVEATVQRVQRDRQPAVIHRAATWFSQVTDGHYRQLVAPDDALAVVDDHGRLVDPAVLSRGTKEQLYLCLRFALAEELGSASTPLPLLLDDILVNMDPVRMQRMIEVIVDVATRQQVVFFTCHPHVVEQIRAVAPGAQHIELGR